MGCDNMFENKLVPFVIKQIVLYLLMLSVLALFLINQGQLYLGLFTGAALSIIRFISNAWIFLKGIIGSKNNYGHVVVTASLFIMNQLLLLAVLALFYRLSSWLFVGLIVGVLLAPFAIVVNGITEALGITKNKFYID